MLQEVADSGLYLLDAKWFEYVIVCSAFKTFDFESMADAIPDELVDEIAIACTPDEAVDRMAQWQDLTDEALLYPPAVGVPPERLRSNIDAMLDLFGNR